MAKVEKEYYYFLYSDGVMGRSDKKLTIQEASDMADEFDAMYYLAEYEVDRLVDLRLGRK